METNNLLVEDRPRIVQGGLDDGIGEDLPLARISFLRIREIRLTGT